MLNFPKATEFGRTIPKESFYKNLSLSTEMKDKFVSDIKKIVWKYKLAPSTLNIEKGETVAEILVLTVELKKQAFDTKILELISKQNSHKVVYLLSFDNSVAIALYMGKVYKTRWQYPNDLTLEIKGLNLDKVWDNFISQIALTDPQAAVADISVAEQLARQEQKEKLQKDIASLENKIQNTKQFNLQVKLKQELLIMKERLQNNAE